MMVLSTLIFLIVFKSVAGDDLRFIALGDWGVNDTQQVWVAEAMDAYCGTVRCDFIVSLGDNFYGPYMNSSDDPRFDTHWRDIYTGENIKDLTWYISLGNHDSSVFKAEFHQVEFGETEPRWYLPWLWYDFYVDLGDSLVHFVAIDTPSLLTFKNNVTEQRLWINETIENSMGDWVIVYGHHPMYSAGRYPGYPRLHRDVQAVMEESGTDVYMCGHDHNTQHIMPQTNDTFDLVVNGAGGRGLYEYSRVNERYMTQRGMELVYFEEQHGFVAVTVNAQRMIFDYYTIQENPDTGAIEPLHVYQFHRAKEN